jgi:hypothetical protein
VDEALRSLLELAFRRVPAREANAAIARVRSDEAIGGRPVRSYELVLSGDATFAALAESTLPRLVYHLESLGARPPAFEGMVLSIFAGDELCFVRVADFLPAAARLAGATVAELYERHGTGELRTAVRDPGPPLALPPGPPKQK